MYINAPVRWVLPWRYPFLFVCYLTAFVFLYVWTYLSFNSSVDIFLQNAWGKEVSCFIRQLSQKHVLSISNSTEAQNSQQRETSDHNDMQRDRNNDSSIAFQTLFCCKCAVAARTQYLILLYCRHVYLLIIIYIVQCQQNYMTCQSLVTRWLQKKN